MTDLLLPQKIVIDTEGSLVVFQVGNSVMKMPYADAIKVSTWLRIKGKEAKRFAGDDSRHWSVIGQLDGLINGDRPFRKREF